MTWVSRTPLDHIETHDENGVDWLDVTKWVRNKSDELAIKNGCFFSPERAAWALWWQESQIKLYEAPFAGHPIRFLTSIEDPKYHDDELGADIFWDIPPWAELGAWDHALEFYKQRMRRHNQQFAKGEIHRHWHFEAVAQIYGNCRISDDDRWPGARVRRFTDSMIWVPKKHGKSPWSAAQALYMTFGDNTAGAATAFAAANLQQAKSIVGVHLRRMVEQMDDLGPDLKFNQNDCSVTYVGGDKRMYGSRIFPLSAGDERSANTSHGFSVNAYVTDEAHVINRRVRDRLYRATRSRREPLGFTISTAGDNPESFGKTLFDRSENIRDGVLAVDDTYVAIYAAPQDVTNEQLDKDIRKYIKMASPALGHIVSLEQSVKDYEKSKTNSLDLATYKYEILNVWVNASHSWLPPNLWASCGGWSFEPSDLEGPCVIGFDNAAKHDLACAVLTWEYWFNPATANNPEAMLDGIDIDDPNFDPNTQFRRGVIQRPIFWTNDRRLAELQAIYDSFGVWEKEGLIRSNRGTSNSDHQIALDLREMCERYDVRGFVHDPWHCEHIVNVLTQGMTGPDGEIITEPVLSPEQIKPMPQSTHALAGPVSSYEADLRREIIGHEDHPILTWQFGHAAVEADKNGNIKVVKENRKSFRTVDGVQAAIMGRWGLLDYGKFVDTRLSYYENNGLEEL